MEVTLDVFNGTLQLLLVMISTILLPVLAVGLLVSMFQAATQINEMTLSFVPKIFVAMGTLFVAGPYLLRLVEDFSERLFSSIPALIN